MDLVLFEDAMKHVARICRIISSPSGRGHHGGNSTDLGTTNEDQQRITGISLDFAFFDVFLSWCFLQL